MRQTASDEEHEYNPDTHHALEDHYGENKPRGSTVPVDPSASKTPGGGGDVPTDMNKSAPLQTGKAFLDKLMFWKKEKAVEEYKKKQSANIV